MLATHELPFASMVASMGFHGFLWASMVASMGSFHGPPWRTVDAADAIGALLAEGRAFVANVGGVEGRSIRAG